MTTAEPQYLPVDLYDTKMMEIVLTKEIKPLPVWDDSDDEESTDTTLFKTSSTIIRIPKPWVNRWVLNTLVFVLALASVIVCTILIGARIEKRHFHNAPSTLTFYSTPDVCAMKNILSDNPDFSTFPKAQEAHLDGYKVAHCGSCGHCSNLHDIDIQAKTTNTLTTDSTKCAFRIFTGGPKAVHKCMEEMVGFTKPCEDCWVDDIECNVRHCKFTCLKSKYLFRDMRDNNEEDGALNDCLECDEKMCGPKFVKCSGSNRRRLGIISDISRDNEHERCHSVDVDWEVAANIL